MHRWGQDNTNMLVLPCPRIIMRPETAMYFNLKREDKDPVSGRMAPPQLQLDDEHNADNTCIPQLALFLKPSALFRKVHLNTCLMWPNTRCCPIYKRVLGKHTDLREDLSFPFPLTGSHHPFHTILLPMFPTAMHPAFALRKQLSTLTLSPPQLSRIPYS